jgi:Ca-activated chloride channel family protein
MNAIHHASSASTPGATIARIVARPLAAATLALAVIAGSAPADAAGTLTVSGSDTQPVRILDHDVNVTINNGFARVAVTQRFENPNEKTVEALYAMPVPEGAALSEMHVAAGELVLDGEVLPKAQAQQAYAEEKAQGREAGLATKESYQRYEFRVSPLPPKQAVTVNFVYYQPLSIDTGVGRFVYPLAEGGTDDVAQSFWTRNEKVESSFSVDLTLKSAWPVDDVRAPGMDAVAKTTQVGKDTWHLRAEQQGGSLAKDFVFYYRLAENLPGRVEVVPYRASAEGDGTFMLVVTPGVDLKPLGNGADYIFLLDVSGSMSGKLHTLARGVGKAIGNMQPQDRFRVVTFNEGARELIGWTAATPENVKQAIASIESLQSSGSTNLYAGLHEALGELDADRVSSLVLVTDGVANTGVIDPKEFAKLLARNDLRVFGFLMGNSANWPLMRIISEASGGFYAGVSNDDDITGQIMLARSKVLSEAMHNVDLQVSGAGVHDIAGRVGRKIYRGQQVVLFGRYSKPGPADIVLKAALSGEDKVYRTRVQLPAIDTSNPEIERLWAMAKVEDLEKASMLGLADARDTQDAIRDIGVKYQIVNDETAMVVMRDAAFAQRGIERRNRERMAQERAAQQQRAAAPVQNHRTDSGSNGQEKPMFPGSAASLGGGGSMSVSQLLMLLLLGVASVMRRRANAGRT